VIETVTVGAVQFIGSELNGMTADALKTAVEKMRNQSASTIVVLASSSARIRCSRCGRLGLSGQRGYNAGNLGKSSLQFAAVVAAVGHKSLKPVERSV